MTNYPSETGAVKLNPLRWGFVGTGNIASWMAGVVGTTAAATLCGVASRSMATAQSFAAQHGAQSAFDSWQEMLGREEIDAVYIATPTSLREEIAIAAANASKHVLGEKPFASLASLKRITAACRRNGVAFMDATHFVHHPRYTAIRDLTADLIGRPRSMDTRFLISLTDRSDIRYNPTLEPLGALGDLGWYNMRAIVEYLEPGSPVRQVSSRLHRDDDTGAVIAGEGLLIFDDGAETTWQFSFDAASVDIGLELTGTGGCLHMNNFIGEDEDHSASYQYARGVGSDQACTRIASRQSGPASMFEDFAAVAQNVALRERWMQSSESTQALLDSVFAAARS